MCPGKKNSSGRQLNRPFAISAMSTALITHISSAGPHGETSNVEASRHYLTGVLVFLSLAAGGAVASAAETGTTTMPDSSIYLIAYTGQGAAYRYGPHRPFYGYRGFYDYAGPRAGHCSNPWYDDRWDPTTWSTGNSYY
jgi:hypothetical protein